MVNGRVTIEKLSCARDARGFVFEPLDASGLAQQRNVHVVLTLPGHIRGNHSHRVGTEVTAVVGPARVSYREGGQHFTVDVPPNEVWRFVFPQHVPHALQNSGDAPMVIVSFNTVEHDPQNPDTVRDLVDPDEAMK